MTAPLPSSDEPVTTSRPMAVRLVRGMAGLAALQEAWLGLEGASGEPDFFQSFAWSMHVAETRSRIASHHYEPLAAVGESNGRVVALWPLSIQRRAGLRQLCSLDDPFGQFCGLLALDRTAAATLVGAALRLLKAEKAASLACFERVLAGSALAEALSSAGASSVPGVEAPYVELSRFGSFAALKASRNRKTMKNQRNAYNRLQRAGAVECLRPRDAATVLAVADLAVRNREQWLTATGNTAPAFRDPAWREVLLGADHWGLESQRIAFELLVGGRSLAQQFGFVYRDRYYAYISGMDWDHEALAPGRLHLAMVLEALSADGIGTAELLTPASDYKMMWTDSVRRLTDIVLPLSPVGRIRQAVWSDRLRPALKRTYYALPVGLRRSVMRLMHGRSGH